MRGKAFAPAPTIDIMGITPAYAGKRAAGDLLPWQRWDHPRVCGEKVPLYLGNTAGAGSPPRMRGKVVVSRNLCLLSGITPAYAGKRGWPHSTMKAARDHPRVCGEKHEPACTQVLIMGSPPRMRGKERHASGRNQSYRITPAYAGKSHTAKAAPTMNRGSPPRMRGKAWADYRMKPNRGITPAYAGKRQYP